METPLIFNGQTGQHPIKCTFFLSEQENGKALCHSGHLNLIVLCLQQKSGL